MSWAETKMIQGTIDSPIYGLQKISSALGIDQVVDPKYSHFAETNSSVITTFDESPRKILEIDHKIKLISLAVINRSSASYAEKSHAYAGAITNIRINDKDVWLAKHQAHAYELQTVYQYTSAAYANSDFYICNKTNSYFLGTDYNDDYMKCCDINLLKYGSGNIRTTVSDKYIVDSAANSTNFYKIGYEKIYDECVVLDKSTNVSSEAAISSSSSVSSFITTYDDVPIIDRLEIYVNNYHYGSGKSREISHTNTVYLEYEEI